MKTKKKLSKKTKVKRKPVLLVAKKKPASPKPAEGALSKQGEQYLNLLVAEYNRQKPAGGHVATLDVDGKLALKTFRGQEEFNALVKDIREGKVKLPV